MDDKPLEAWSCQPLEVAITLPGVTTMSVAPEKQPLPQWLIWVGSAVIVFHFFALLIVVLAVPSGPWPSPFGPPDTQEPPVFAQEISDWTTLNYLQPLQLASSYHFESNRPDLDSVYFEARLRDAQGDVMQTIKFPQDQANFWVRNRQVLLAQKLGIDNPVRLPRGETIPAPGKEPPKVTIWDSPGAEPHMQLRQIPMHLVRQDRPVFGPSPFSLQLARSYAHYLCQHYGAKSAELIRHSRRPVYPTLMFEREPPPDAFEEIVCSFGEKP